MAPPVGTKRSDEETKATSSDQREHLAYMVTIKCNHIGYTSLEELNEIYMWLVKKIKGAHWHTKYAVELDGLKRLHIHGLFTRPSKVNPASYRKKGYTVHFQLLDSYERAHAYINKEDQKPEAQQQREAESYYYNNYGFI